MYMEAGTEDGEVGSELGIKSSAKLFQGTRASQGRIREAGWKHLWDEGTGNNLYHLPPSF